MIDNYVFEALLFRAALLQVMLVHYYIESVDCLPTPRPRIGSSSRLVAPGVALGSSSLAPGVALGVAIAMANAIAGARSACCANHGFNGVRATRLPSPGESEPNPTPFGSNIGYQRVSVCTFCLPAGGGYLVQCFRPELVCERSRLFVECFQTISSKAHTHTHTNTRQTQQLAGNSGETRVKIWWNSGETRVKLGRARWG